MQTVRRLLTAAMTVFVNLIRLLILLIRGIIGLLVIVVRWFIALFSNLFYWTRDSVCWLVSLNWPKPERPSMTIASEEWDLSKERNFIETLVQQRFNFLLVSFSLTIAGAARADTRLMQFAIFSIGAVLCWFVGQTVRRAHDKLDLILKRLHKVHGHPVKVIGDELKFNCRSENWSSYIFGPIWKPIVSIFVLLRSVIDRNAPQVDMIGMFVPWLCVLCLVVFAWMTAPDDFDLPRPPFLQAAQKATKPPAPKERGIKVVIDDEKGIRIFIGELP